MWKEQSWECSIVNSYNFTAAQLSMANMDCLVCKKEGGVRSKQCLVCTAC